ncbi:hypothetical protein NP233_g5991 [Leucocoprinus birnbaumii]|uniref:Uncharacterized protein n=1 Tax=Leucocoprinus birnbaumii TaxID=56174 RepID=A0AAD5YW68_9AGAR|nr:hypothetical protein NP233_g5991 [Leucocoprinus birnbaumii]
MATGGYNLRSRKSALVTPASKGIGGTTVGDVAAPANPTQNVEPVVNCIAGADFYIGSSVPADNVSAVNEHVVFAINPLDEPNDHLSPEQLDAVNQAVANLSDKQRDSYRRRHPKTPNNVQASASRDKGKGADPCNWGAADIPEYKLETTTQHALLEKANQNAERTGERAKKHKKRSKTKEHEHRKRSKDKKKSKTRKEVATMNDTRQTSVFSNALAGIANHICCIANASKGNTTSRLTDSHLLSWKGTGQRQGLLTSTFGQSNEKTQETEQEVLEEVQRKGKSKNKYRHRGSQSSDELSSDSSSSDDYSNDDHNPDSPSDNSSSSSSSESSTSSSSSSSGSDGSDNSSSDSKSTSSDDTDYDCPNH